MNVTVGIPVYNEEKNIQKLLKSLALQEGIFIEKTIIVNDGYQNHKNSFGTFHKREKCRTSMWLVCVIVLGMG